MKGNRRCQCGAKPVYRVERDDIRDKRRRRIRERIVCPFCGNATAPHSSRRALREEWNLSGWCGMGEVLSLEHGRDARSGDAAWKLVAAIGASFTAVTLACVAPILLAVLVFFAVGSWFIIKLLENDQ